MKGLRRDQRGFTLIDLMVVFAAFGIIAAIVIPMISNAQARRRVDDAKKNAEAIATAVAKYRDFTGGPPEQLSDLTRELTIRSVTTGPFLAEIPAPPKGWKPFEYTRTEDEYFITTGGDRVPIVVRGKLKPPGS